MARKQQTSQTAPATGGAKFWIDSIASALRRERDFRKEGKEILSIYQGEKVATTPFNILYSNTETLSPALYSNKPKPVVKRRYDDKDPTGLAASQMLRRGLEFMLDDINQAETGFHDAMQAAVTSALLPGRGITTFRYNAEVETDDKGPRRVTYEDIEIENVSWENFCHGYAKEWRYVPWVALKEPPMTRQEAAKIYGEEVAAKLPYAAPGGEDDDNRADGHNSRDVPVSEWIVEVWVVWDKKAKNVKHVCMGYPDALLKEEAPKTKFKGFFPVPRPLAYFRKVDDLTPRALYTLYKQQAEELNTMTRRIKSLINACRVRGAYDSNVAEISRMLTAEENQLIPISNAAALYGQQSSLDKTIWLWPLEKIQATLQTLYQERETAKQVLYEIMGVADIMRGASAASETLGAQRLKNTWGSLRLKRMQNETVRYVRDCLRLMAEILAENFTPATLRSMSNLPLMTNAEKQMVQQQLQVTQAPPAPEIQAALQQPTMEEVQKLLQDQASRDYRIDVETNSTVENDATDNKEELSEVMTAIGQFVSTVGPMVQQGIIPMPVAKALLTSICRRFRFGEEVEVALESMPMQAPPAPQEGEKSGPTGPDPAAVKAIEDVKLRSAQASAQTRAACSQRCVRRGRPGRRAPPSR